MDYGRVSVLGSTGSIGTQTLDVCERLGIRVSAIAAGKNITLLEQQARKFKPDIVSVLDGAAASDLKVRLADTPCKVLSGEGGTVEAACAPDTKTVVTAVVGTAGLIPTIEAIKERKRIALANKETLVCAGNIVMKMAEECGSEIIPVDSEHSAIFQSMDNKSGVKPERIILTASGGPFRGKTYDEIKNAPAEAALKHPNWSMGAKVTIDSASMMNKGLEFIEAMHLFGVAPDNIDVVVHPQSIVHSAVMFRDGSVIAQMGVPDMRIPIQYAITYPNREVSPVKKLDLCEYANLTFEKPDLDTFRCLKLAMKAARMGGVSCAVMNAANEIAVQLYLKKVISFGGIYETVASAVENIKGSGESLEEIINADKKARRFAAEKYIV